MAYVDNEAFHEELVAYTKRVAEARANGLQEPRVTESIGKKILLIVNGLSKHPSYCGYTYIDEMVSEAIDNCIRCVKNYNPDVETKGGKPSPFNYFTMVSARAFIRMIYKEKKQMATKAAILRNSGVIGDLISGSGFDEEDEEQKNHMLQYLDSVLGKDSIGYGSYEHEE